jgi:G-protein alpha subunit
MSSFSLILSTLPFPSSLPEVSDLLTQRLVGRRFGSFLDDIERIATKDYEPSDNDVIRARLRTLGVQEYSFWVEQGMEALLRRVQIKLCSVGGHEWLMYDVGGTRSSVGCARVLICQRPRLTRLGAMAARPLVSIL